MLKMSRKPSKKLAKVVLATLLFTGGAQLAISPSVVEAVSPTIIGTIVKDGSKIIFTEASCTWSGSASHQGAGNVALGGPTALSQTPAEGYNVTITEATGWYRFDGAYLNSHSSTIKDNTLTVNGGSFSYGVAGGTIFASGNNLVTKNTVIVNDGTMYEACGGLIQAYGGIPGDAIDNTVYINGGQVEYVCGGSADKGDANDNKVFIKGGVTSDGVVGGLVRYEYGGDANGNTVTISGGTIGKDGYTTYIRGGNTSGVGKSASNNTITIAGNANLLGDVYVYGGTVQPDDNSTAANNTVNILKSITLKGLYGGIAVETQSYGNTLNIAAKNVVTKDLNAFQNMNFYLPSDIANGDTMLTIKGNEGMTTPAYLKGVTFGVAALSGVNLQKGDTVNLVVGNNGLTTDDTLNVDSSKLASASFLTANNLATDKKYELSISKKDENTIITTVDNVKEDPGPLPTPGPSPTPTPTPDYSNNERLKSLVETREAAATMLNAGTDLLTGQGMQNAADAAAERDAGGGFNTFAAVGVSKLRAQSGSHVDTKGIGLNLGFAREIENKSGKLLFGPVLEYGHGSYDSYQDNGIKADGKASYWGIGIIARQTNNNGLYYEGSIRAGRVKSDYDSDLSAVTHASYDSSSTYWAAHAGIGKLMDIGNNNTLDVYGKYFYSHTGSDRVTVHATGGDEEINFRGVNSHRVRAGARFIHAINEKNKIYGGLAYQYEFGGEARAIYNGGSTPSPSVKGSSGLIELGWQVKPGKKSPMTIDVGVAGWVGKQRGITANVQANWTF